MIGLELASIIIGLMTRIICFLQVGRWCVCVCVRERERERGREKLSWGLLLSLSEDQQSLISKICSPLAMIFQGVSFWEEVLNKMTQLKSNPKRCMGLGIA